MSQRRISHHGVAARRRFATLVVIGALVLGACSGGGDDATAVSSNQRTTSATSAPPATEESTATDDEDMPRLPDVTAEPWEPETRTDELTVTVSGNEPTPQQAVDAFALLYPDMPGATPSDLPAGEGLDETFTWLMIRHVYDRLAPDQQAAVNAASAGDVIGTIEEDGSGTTTDVADEEIPGVGDPPADTTPSTGEPGGFVRPRRRGPSQTYARYHRLAVAVWNEWRTHRPDMPMFTIDVVLSKAKISGGGMNTGAHPTIAGRCKVTVDPGFVKDNLSDAEIKFFFAHEFFHCIQFQWNQAATWQWKIAQWVFDGSADFAAADLYRGTLTASPKLLWQNWFTQPNKPLSARSYDAFALFETQYQRGVDPFPGIQAMIVGSPNGNVTHDLTPAGMNALFFRMDWSTKGYRSTKHPATDWQLAWPGPNTGYGPRETAKSAGGRGLGSWDVKMDGGYVHPTFLVQISDDVGYIDVVPSNGPLTTETANGVLHIPEGASERLCFSDDECKCPDEASTGARQMAGREMIFSLAASENATMAHVEAHKWDKKAEREKCKKKKPKRGSSNGDPHLVSFDGQPFDMMSLGEFVTSRDPAGDFEVQTRNIASAGLGGGSLSSAVAIRAGGSRVTFTVADIADPDGVVVRVDGEPTTETSLDLDGIALQRTDTADALLTWPDGTTVELHFDFGYFVTITPSDERAAVLEGMLGSANGDFLDDLRLPDGTVVDPVDASVPDGEFSKAWQVTDETTLFDYGDGESVATFALPYPGDAFEQVIDQAMQQQCQDALGPDAASHEVTSCAYDVTVTGNDAYVETYQRVVDDRVSAEEGEVIGETPETVPPASAATPSATGDAALTLSGSLIASYSASATAKDVAALDGSVSAASGTVMLFRAERCPADTTLFLTVTQRASGEAGTQFICDPQDIQLGLADEDDEAVDGEVYMWLPADGDYDIDITTDADDASFVSVAVYVDTEPTIVDGSDVLTKGWSGSLDGVADTVVITSADAGATFTATGLDVACAQEAYGAEPVGTDSVWALAAFCAHGDTVSVPGSSVPLVLFSRTPDPVSIELAPQ